MFTPSEYKHSRSARWQCPHACFGFPGRSHLAERMSSGLRMRSKPISAISFGANLSIAMKTAVSPIEGFHIFGLNWEKYFNQ